MNSKNSILIIGAGINQLPIIKTAKRLGYYVIAVSPMGDYPGLLVADEVLHEDIFNKEKILEFARGRNDIGGVLSDQSDMAVPIVAYIAEQLGLPGMVGYEKSYCFTDKAKMREVLEKAGLPVAQNKTVVAIDEARFAAKEIGYPVVIKPVDSFASRGVIKANDDNEVCEKFEFAMSQSRSGKLVVEKHISGPQYFSQGFVDEYEYYLFAFSDRYYFNLPDLFLPYTNAFPAKINNRLKDKMNEYMQRIIKCLKPKFGHVWAEWIYDDCNDILYPIEFAIRGAGAYVTTHVITNAYNIDTQPYLVKSAMGCGPVGFKDVKPENHAAAFYCFLLPEGIITKVEGIKEIERIPGVVMSDIRPLKVGDVVPPLKDKNSRIGPIVIKGETRDEVDAIRAKIMKTIDIRVMTKDGEKGAIWE
jgi:biotin carboxylase